MQTERIATTKNWLGRNSLQFLETLTQAEKDRHNMTKGLFNTVIQIFKLQYNKTIKSLKF